MSLLVEMAVVAIKTTILVLGGLITYLAYKAFDRRRDEALGLLALGFAIVTVGALFGGIAHQLLDVSITVGVLIDSLLTAIGFAIITYSLYTE